ncbi:MAG: hypothetical protein A2Y33_12610 [Spirochaetes bacterium GWF1_51_8]|nr:MAG: hypothetical protein A2Y33_12610 [Spirochaetes bacterium GWF1_51_8]
MKVIRVLLTALLIELGLTILTYRYDSDTVCSIPGHHLLGYPAPQGESEKQAGMKQALVEKTIAILESYNEMNDAKRAILPSVVDSAVRYSETHKLDPELVLAVIFAESRFVPDVVSSAGAKGLMQVLNPDFDHLPDEVLFDIDRNIEMGVIELAGYFEKLGSVMKALYRYNGMKMKTYPKSVQISKESYFYAIQVMDIYYDYKNG